MPVVTDGCVGGPVLLQDSYVHAVSKSDIPYSSMANGG